MRALHQCLSDGCDHSAAQIRCAALHFVSHDRTERLDSARASVVDRRPHFRLRRLSGRVPWNRFAKVSRESAFAARKSTAAYALRGYLRLDEVEFRHRFRYSPIKRI